MEKLKCWKKSSPNTWTKEGIIVSVAQNVASKKWNATARSRLSSYYFLDKEFKTKIQALKSANSYIKKNGGKCGR